MFEDLYDALSMLWSWSWPTAPGEISLVEIERIGDGRNDERIRLSVCYKFWVGDDGPYTGESFWNPQLFIKKRIKAARTKVRKGQTVLVRYRNDDPSVNRLDKSAWRGL
jgi:hypothetical protein